VKRSIDPTVRMLQALGDPVRLSIVRQLASDGDVCACDLTCCGEVSQPTVSHHLRVLREAGVVTSERRGTWIHYSLVPEAIARLRVLAVSLEPAGPRPASELAGRRLRVLQGTGPQQEA
jgi:ArsR family transcriptional regulator, arsenate/arsenite/antimonite-responsive transcriptional repressor